ncbi:hypothetical protein EJB05_17621, partial [Eragrostis curvula]
MAGSSEWRSHVDVDGDELEEGEFVTGPGYHSESDTEEYYNRYSSSESDDEATSKACSYSVPTKNVGASSSSVAANDDGYASSSSAVAAPVLACRICGKEFTSTKAVCGHMKVHALEAQWRQEQGYGKTKEKKVKRIAAVERGWGFTGKRGFPRSRCRAVSLNALLNAEPESSITAVVAAEPKLVLDPTPLAYAASNLSPVRAAALAKTDPSGEGSRAQSMHDDAMAVVVAPTADPAAEAVVHQQQTALLPAENEAAPVHQHRAAPSAAGAQNPDGSAATRKHYTGEPIVPKKKQRLDEPVPPPPADVVVPQLDPADVDMADLSLALPVEADVQSPAATVEGTPKPVQPAPSPAVEGRVILFGIDIGLGVQRPTVHEDPPATKDDDSLA